MKIICKFAVLAVLFAMLSADAMAQRGGPGGRGGGDTGGRGGGDTGGRGGFGGGDTGGRGGFGGGGGGAPAFGGRGGDTGGRGGVGGGGAPGAGGRGGFGGGPPGGGFGGAPAGGRGGAGGPSGFMSRLDGNGDGRLDQGELDKIPDGFKQMMQSRGIQLRPGSIEEISNNMRAQFEQGRQGGEDGGRPEAGSDSNKTAYSPASPFRPRQKERMTIDLPPKYSELDLDFDGQIGLYEWITAKRESLNEFDEIDADIDGLLTPRELKFYDEISAAGEAKVVSYKPERVRIIDGSGTFNSKRPGDNSSQKSTMSAEDRQKTEESGKKYFASMDKNKNGKVDADEWAASSRIRPWFEKSGIKMGAMSEQEFSQNFVKAVEMMKQGQGKESGGGKDRGDRGGDRGSRR